MAATVYLITSPDGRKYAGCTTQPLRMRWTQHLSNGLNRVPGPLYDAMRLHGRERFKIKAVFEGPIEEALKKERGLIKDLDLMNPAKGFNRSLNPGGKGRQNPKRLYTFSTRSRKESGRVKVLGKEEKMAAFVRKSIRAEVERREQKENNHA